ncbi:MAG: hypothetical protein JHC21_03210 [Thermocrinis sp.]|nr:hypothetical protein [Thermocrinis sp.]
MIKESLKQTLKKLLKDQVVVPLVGRQKVKKREEKGKLIRVIVKGQRAYI